MSLALLSFVFLVVCLTHVHMAMQQTVSCSAKLDAIYEWLGEFYFYCFSSFAPCEWLLREHPIINRTLIVMICLLCPSKIMLCAVVIIEISCRFKLAQGQFLPLDQVQCSLQLVYEFILIFI